MSNSGVFLEREQADIVQENYGHLPEGELDEIVVPQAAAKRMVCASTGTTLVTVRAGGKNDTSRVPKHPTVFKNILRLAEERQERKRCRRGQKHMLPSSVATQLYRNDLVVTFEDHMTRRPTFLNILNNSDQIRNVIVFS